MSTTITSTVLFFVATLTLLHANVGSAAKLRAGPNCADARHPCPPGTLCVGTKRTKMCTTGLLAGKPCDRNPFSKCASGLSCMHGVCAARVRAGADCSAPGSKCVVGAVCIGGPSRQKCVYPKSIGAACGRNLFCVCAHGLVCMHDHCVIPPVMHGAPCGAHTAPCVTGTVCARGVCADRVYKGAKCGASMSDVCGGKLACVNGVCK